MGQKPGIEGGRPSTGVEERAAAISSRENKWLKLFRAGLRGTGPSGDDFIAIEGPKLVEEALRSGLEAEALLVSATGEHHMNRVLLAASESETGIRRERILRTTDKLFSGVAGTEMPQGVAGLFHQPSWAIEDVTRGTHAATAGNARTGTDDAALVVVLAGLQDPGNVGTILRSAEAFGATGAVAARGTADPWSPKALRASAGSALRLPLVRGMAVPVLLAQLKMEQVKIVAASVRSVKERPDAQSFEVLRGPAALFIGSEGVGLPLEIERAADAVVSIPMSESVESLNAAIAASLLLYEAARQRGGTV